MAALVVHVVPRARRTEVAGRHGGIVKIRLAAPPVDGAANDELVRFVAACVGVPRSAVTIESGARSRRKTIAVAGVAPSTVAYALLGKSQETEP
jgi:uncharacterized protein